MPEFPHTFPLDERRDLLLDTDHMEAALDACLERGTSLEVRSSV